MLFAQGRIADANAILQKDWPENKKDIGSLVRAYVGNDERGSTFSRRYRIADENNVSFPDLMKYALSTDIEKEQQPETRTDQATSAKESLSKSIADTAPEVEVSNAIDRLFVVTDQAMFAEDWDQAIELTRMLLDRKPDNLMAKSRLAIALLYKQEEKEAREIIEGILPSMISSLSYPTGSVCRNSEML
jgi:hypothetical protein